MGYQKAMDQTDLVCVEQAQQVLAREQSSVAKLRSLVVQRGIKWDTNFETKADLFSHWEGHPYCELTPGKGTASRNNCGLTLWRDWSMFVTVFLMRCCSTVRNNKWDLLAEWKLRRLGSPNQGLNQGLTVETWGETGGWWAKTNGGDTTELWKKVQRKRSLQKGITGYLVIWEPNRRLCKCLFP